MSRKKAEKARAFLRDLADVCEKHKGSVYASDGASVMVRLDRANKGLLETVSEIRLPQICGTTPAERYIVQVFVPAEG